MGLLKIEDASSLFGKCFILVGCGKSKRKSKSQAQDLYTGSLTSMSIKWACRNSDKWGILSAKWGLLSPNEEIAPYNLKMSNLSCSEKENWREMFWSQWKKFHWDGSVIILAGKDYLDAIGPFSDKTIVYVPMNGLKMGNRMAWLKAHPILTNEILTRSHYATN